MDEHDIEFRLSRYRPASPPPELRRLAMHSAAPDRMWPWAAAAAVLLTATVAIHFATTSALSRIAPPVSDPASALADAMGGDEDARRAARLIVMEQLILDSWKRRDVNAELEDLINASR